MHNVFEAGDSHYAGDCNCCVESRACFGPWNRPSVFGPFWGPTIELSMYENTPLPVDQPEEADAQVEGWVGEAMRALFGPPLGSPGTVASESRVYKILQVKTANLLNLPIEYR